MDRLDPCSDEILFGSMAIQLDEIDVRLLRELETDADRPNVELARLDRALARGDAQPRPAAEGVGRDPQDRGAAGLRDRRVHAAGLRDGHARAPRRGGGEALQRRGGRDRQHHRRRLGGRRDGRAADDRRARRRRAAARALAPVHARGRAAADHAAAARGAQAFIAAARTCDIRPIASGRRERAGRSDGHGDPSQCRVHDPGQQPERRPRHARRHPGGPGQDAGAARRRDPAALDRCPAADDD